MADGAPGPLAGRRVVVTRTAEQAGTLAATLAAAGAAVLEVPVIAVVEPADGGRALADAVARLVTGEYAWLVLTSANGVARVLGVLGERPLPAATRVAAVGRATAQALEAAGVAVDLVPERFVGEELVAAFPRAGAGAAGGRVLLPQAAGARPVVAEGLRRRGWLVDAVVAYRTAGAPVDEAAARSVAAADAVTFTSASTVTHLVAAVGPGGLPPVVVCIGPVSAAAARELGVAVSAEAAEASVPGLVAALVEVLGG